MVQIDTHNPNENTPTTSSAREGGDRENQWRCEARTNSIEIGCKILTATQLM
jgi:hypothetical protein